MPAALHSDRSLHSPAIHEHSVSPGLMEQLGCWWDPPQAYLWLLKWSPQRSTSHQQAGQARQGAGSEDVFGQMVLLPLGR